MYNICGFIEVWKVTVYVSTTTTTTTSTPITAAAGAATCTTTIYLVKIGRPCYDQPLRKCPLIYCNSYM